MKLCRLKAFTPMPACRYRQEQRATRSRLARRSFTAKLPGQPAPGVRARAALARRLALISRSALGFGRRKPSEHHEYHRKRGTAAKAACRHNAFARRDRFVGQRRRRGRRLRLGDCAGIVRPSSLHTGIVACWLKVGRVGYWRKPHRLLTTVLVLRGQKAYGR